MILDTTVLIDLQKEHRSGQPGAASRLLEASGDAAVFITFVTWLEFAEGFGDDDRVAGERFQSFFQVLGPTWRRPGGPPGSHAPCRRRVSPSGITICGSPPWRYSTAVRSRPETNGTSDGFQSCPSARTEPLAGGACQI